MRIMLDTGTPAECARPDGPTTGTLVLFPDIFGLRPLFDEHARRLSTDHGVDVIVIEPFPSADVATIEDRQNAVAQLSDADKLADLDAALRTVDASSCVVLGFCMGGMYAMKSLADPRVSKAVAFYGMVRMPDAWASDVQHDALDTVKARHADATLDLLCIFGGDDPWCPDADQDDVEAAGATVVRYPGAGHGWAQDASRDIYRPNDAADAWAKAEAFLFG